MNSIDPKFIVKETTYNSNDHLDTNNYYNSEFGKPDQLTDRLVALFGSQSGMYPLSQQMQGDLMGRTTSKKVKSEQYHYPVMGREYKAAMIAQAPPTTTPNDLGAGGKPFYLYFTDNWVKRQYILISQNGVMVRVHGDLEYLNGVWRAQVSLNPYIDGQLCPVSEVQAGVKWAVMFAPVSFERSRGTGTNSVTPGRLRNQLGVMRKSMSWGASQNLDRMMDIEVMANGASTKSWMSWWIYQFEKQWLEECELAYWYSRYNRDAVTGQVTLKDLVTGEPIPTFAGVLEQISAFNYSSYTELSYKELSNKIGDALFASDDTDNMSVTLYTGRGGMREFHEAIKAGLGEVVPLQVLLDGNKFVEGRGRELALNGFFNAFYHIDGYYIKVKHNPLFDKGRMAQASVRHPKYANLPLESFRMVFIDDSAVDGQSNIQYVEHEGIPMQHSVNLGLTNAPREFAAGTDSVFGGNPPERSSEVDEGSYHRKKSHGIQILRPNRCFHMECIAGQ